MSRKWNLRPCLSGGLRPSQGVPGSIEPCRFTVTQLCTCTAAGCWRVAAGPGAFPGQTLTLHILSERSLRAWQCDAAERREPFLPAVPVWDAHFGSFFASPVSLFPEGCHLRAPGLGEPRPRLWRDLSRAPHTGLVVFVTEPVPLRWRFGNGSMCLRV